MWGAAGGMARSLTLTRPGRLGVVAALSGRGHQGRASCAPALAYVGGAGP
jgi:hypothetical protein